MEIVYNGQKQKLQRKLNLKSVNGGSKTWRRGDTIAADRVYTEV